jgi:dynein heavy chain
MISIHPLLRYPAVTAVFNDKTITKGLKGERLRSFYSCVSALLSIQLRDLLMRSITSYVSAFQDHRTLPRVEMELVLTGKKIEFSPSCAEVADMIISVVHEMNKLLREVPTIQSWLTGSSNNFVPVTLNKDFIRWRPVPPSRPCVLGKRWQT